MMKISFLQKLSRFFGDKSKKPFSSNPFTKNKVKKFFEIGTSKIKE